MKAALSDPSSRQRLAQLFSNEVGCGGDVHLSKILRDVAIRCKWLPRSCTNEDVTAWDSQIAKGSMAVIFGAHVVLAPLFPAQTAK